MYFFNTHQQLLFAVTRVNHFPRYRPFLYRSDQLQQKHRVLQGGVLEASQRRQLARRMHLHTIVFVKKTFSPDDYENMCVYST